MKQLLLIILVSWLLNFCQAFRFQEELILVTIDEEEPAGSFVARVKAVPDAVKYELSPDAGNLFGINSTTGNISVQNRFDREVLNFIDGTFMVYAFDNAGNQASAQVFYWILDVNDHLPHFPSQYYNVTVGEAVDVNQQIFSATALDKDIEGNGEILYKIIDGNEDGMFKLKDAYHCSVLVAKALDFESRSLYVLNITASNYQESFSNWTVLSISVADEDDLPARFSSYEYNAIVREDTFVGISVIQVTATDQDTINEPVTYEIVESTNKYSLFAINETTGVISLNGSLDRETVSNYRLRVLAYSTFHLPDHAAVEIEVGDVNDHSPIFTDKHYSFVIRENSQIDATVGQVTASDADKGNNATFEYYLLDGEDDFAIDPNTGVLVVNGSLDREKQELYNFLVYARETQTVEMYSSNVTVEVRVEDTNDNSPSFNKPFYEVTVKEEEPSGTPILQVYANDSDTASNAYVTYSLVPDVNNHSVDFSISPVNGTIRSVMQLDRETISEYYLTVKAENDAVQSQRRSSTVSVKVALEDINDHVPIFDEQFYTVTATEAAAVNATILTVKATDKDFGGNGEIRYSVEDGNIGDVFKIDELSGTITVVERLDRETVDVYKLLITAKDGGNRSATVNVTVFVSDVNDNSPQFTLPDGYQFSVVEGVAGLTVGAVKANDSDIGSNAEIFYSLMATPTSDSFRINSSTGEISTTEALDYERFHLHLLIVQTEDRGTPQSRRTAVQVSINVIDVNDNAPKFYKTQPGLNTEENKLFCLTYNTTDFIVMYIQDLTPADTEIGRVTSFDRDEADNAKIFYRIEGNESKVFSIASRTGIIRTNQQLERDQKSVYNLTVIAENSLASPKLSTNLTIQVIVYDVGVQRPQFTSSQYQAEVSESVTVGTSVIKINVTNSKQVVTTYVLFKILYDQSSAGSRKFAIEPEAGLITTQGELDRETTSNYTLIVEAKVLNTDLEHNLLQSVVPVLINVSDVDDNFPRFVQHSYWFTPSELSRVGDVIGHVRAMDVDEDNQAEVFYQIASGNEKGLFNISQNQGTIYVNRSLEQEAASTFHLVIRARDSPEGDKTRKRRGQDITFDEVTATIQISDENNNPPVFTRTHFIGGFYEGEASRNTVVANVQALDKDSGAYGSVLYSIVHEDIPGIFSIDASTGGVTLSNLSAQVTGKLHYTLSVSAVDNLEKVPYHKTNENASVHIFVLSDSTKLSLELGVPLEFVQEKRNEIESMLRNLTGGTVIIEDMQENGDGRTIIYFHAIDNNTLDILTQEDFMSALLNSTDLISGIFRKWNIRMPSDGTAEASTGSRKEFSAVIAAMLVLSVGIGVAGVISIIIACWKKKRQKTVYKTTDNGESPFPLATAWYSMDVPGIEAFIDAKADGTRRSLKDTTRYTVQNDAAPCCSGDITLPRTSLRGSATYKLKNQEGKNDETKRKAVALNHYGSTPHSCTDRSEVNEDCDTTNATAITRSAESHENAGFEHSQGHDKNKKKPGVARKISNAGDTKPDQSNVKGKNRKVRFDLRGAKVKNERRVVMGNIPDIIVISEEAGAGEEFDHNERKLACDKDVCDDNDDMPTDLSSTFENSSESFASVSTINDEEGTVVAI